ncbi:MULTISPECIES: type II toxin-antitoxin system VapC family toxin [Bacteroides]|jgi:tRNA(fMet)-specific endonuclease VapC|uniref:Type II toxin-antitoxin system VapC family toxin n=2 Tax=Bacteroides TaxID=816 RepID=A0A6L3KAF2_9BACE|nr:MULTISPECIES: type II toxin-antitoxin system VapC family toxin [Bacteroides]KAA5422438.1 type II toxin-antitoxin system VapC family toxin [Bacteroides cellulosilyticus]RGV48398.1 type II toxin-antitoxin system VapC family toxin [Bacteroides intestinalis]RHA61109.1 type II toxin-antitoxin system VapC family toxin [Bacteroides intestinalis]
MNKTPKYLLDSNICVYILRGRKGMREQLQKVGWDNCCISEMTVAELLYGAECSSKIEENKKEVLSFCADIEIIPIGLALSEYAHQKAILRKTGSLIDDLDLLIGSTAVAIDCIMVTENVKHLNRIENIQIENWTTI